MKTIFHSAASRGFADHGWLKTHHSFSFAGYYDPEKIHFGALRVLNDDEVAPGMGFGKHPHDNMEIVSIPLEGSLKHGDNMGHEGIIQKGEVQVMSAGTGVVHSEKNASNRQPVKFLQIWVIPDEQNVSPRYDQISIKDGFVKNDFQQIASPNKGDAGVWMHQKAWFYLADFDGATEKEYKIRQKGNGIYIFVLKGELEVANQKLNQRDGIGIWETESIRIKATKASEFLIIDVPMALPEFA